MLHHVPISLFISILLVCRLAVPAEPDKSIARPILAGQKLTGIEFVFSGHRYVLTHPNALWAFERALAEEWGLTKRTESKEDEASLGGTLVVKYVQIGQAGSASLAVTMRNDKGAFRPAAFGGIPCRDDCLLARLLFAIVAGREPRFTKENPVELTDQTIVGGFTPVELRWINFRELTERVSKEHEDVAIRKALEKGDVTRESREDMVSALLLMARHSAEAGDYDKALEYVDRAEAVPREGDVSAASGRPWPLAVRELCDTWRVHLIYIPAGNKAAAREALERMAALHRSEEWKPKAPTPEEQKRIEDHNAQALKRIEADIQKLGAEQ